MQDGLSSPIVSCAIREWAEPTNSSSCGYFEPTDSNWPSFRVRPKGTKASLFVEMFLSRDVAWMCYVLGHLSYNQFWSLLIAILRVSPQNVEWGRSISWDVRWYSDKFRPRLCCPIPRQVSWGRDGELWDQRSERWSMNTTALIRGIDTWGPQRNRRESDFTFFISCCQMLQSAEFTCKFMRST